MEGEWKIVPLSGCQGELGMISLASNLVMVSATSKRGLELK